MTKTKENTRMQQGLMSLETQAQEHVILGESAVWLIDLRGLKCPEPLMMLRQSAKRAKPKDELFVYATDHSTTRDFERFCRFSGHCLQSYEVLTECCSDDALVPGIENREIHCFAIQLAE